MAPGSVKLVTAECQHEFSAGDARTEREERLPGVWSVEEVGTCSKCGEVVRTNVSE